MTNETLDFAEYYPKLKNYLFFTIRKSTGLKPGDQVTITVDQKPIGTAEVNAVKIIKLRYIGDRLLMEDTNAESREAAIEELRRFYPDLTDESVVLLIFLHWSDNPPIPPPPSGSDAIIIEDITQFYIKMLKAVGLASLALIAFAFALIMAEIFLL